jgi:uncharacterized membrane protein
MVISVMNLVGRILMALLYMLAGFNHFWHPPTYLSIMPPWMPAHTLLVAISGVAEIVLGAGLLWTPVSRYAAWGIILLLIAVFPANVQMLINWKHTGHPHLWLAWLRLPIQLLLIAWAYLYTRSRKWFRKV